MELSSVEKLSYVWGPWFFAVLLVVAGISVNRSNPDMPNGIIMICSGLVCMSIYCVCSLLAKLTK